MSVAGTAAGVMFGFVAGGSRGRGVGESGVIAAGLSDCTRVCRHPGGRAVALHGDILGGEMLL